MSETDPNPTPADEPRILVVDDRQPNVILTRRMLGKGGYTKVRSATDSRAAMALVRSWEPDLVLLDLHMPHVGGTEFMDRLRAGGDLGALKVLVVTADTDPEAEQRAMAAGASGVLTKPLDAGALLRSVADLLG
ncbi:MAG: response regulator [Microthrixaceae bacterium]